MEQFHIPVYLCNQKKEKNQRRRGEGRGGERGGKERGDLFSSMVFNL